MNKTVLFSVFGALVAGLCASYLDFHAMQVQAPMLVIFGATFLLGILYGRFAWLSALIVAACLTLSHVIAPHFGISPRDPQETAHIGNPLSLMIVALPAAVSAYIGAGFRSLTRLKEI